MRHHPFVVATLIMFLCSCMTKPTCIPIAQEGKAWHIKTQIPYYDDRYTHDVHMWIAGDTIVDDLTCKKLYKHTKLRYAEDEGTLQIGYCRQEGGKYFQNGELMFDFDLQVGDIFTPQRGMPLTVKAIGDTTLTDGIQRKYLMVVDAEHASTCYYRYDYWIEGIGSLQMGILSNDFISIGVMKRLLHCTHDEHDIYRWEKDNIY